MRTTLLLLTLLSIPATAQDVIVIDRFFWNNSDSPRSELPYAQTGQQFDRLWAAAIFPSGDNGAGDVLCFEATNGADPVNDGCYTVARAVFGYSTGAEPYGYWVIVFEEDPPAWSLSSVEFQVTWDPIELFDDGFEDGTTSSWSSTVGVRGF